jgi:mannose-6-phosphate isomerase
MSKNFIPKVWGAEEIIVNNDYYCGKILHLAPGHRCSLHYHPIKKETFYVLSGDVVLRVGDQSHFLSQGTSYTISPSTPHSFHAVDGPATMIEFSTPHSDDDVVRLAPSV